MKRHMTAALLAGAVLGSCGLLLAQAPKPAAKAESTYKVYPHSDTQFARELLVVSQPDLIKAEEQISKGTTAENLWKSQFINATWDEIAKVRADANKSGAEYVAGMNAYLDATSEGIDGVWALDNAKFIFGGLSQPILNRMEFSGSSSKDRAALAPMAALADRLLKIAASSLEAGTHYLEVRQPFDEAAYMRSFGALAEVDYYKVWGQYFKAMAMEPGVRERRPLLLAAADALNTWADDQSDNGVNKQALFLRGKLRSEAGDYRRAIDDFNKANAPEAPAWVQYQAKYQRIVALIRQQEFAKAYSDFDALKKGLPQDSKEALASAEMLRYRIMWAEADSKDGKDKKDLQLKALAILGKIIQDDSRFRDLIYEQLGSQIPDDAVLADLMPMQQLAVAYSKSQGQKGGTTESNQMLKQAIGAALAVKANRSASAPEKLEATYIAGVCSAMPGIDRLVDAVRYNIEFVELAPNDKRAKPILELALSQIGELRKLPGFQETPEVKDLTERALALSTGKFNDPRFRYIQSVNLETNGKLIEAAGIFEKIPFDDKNYIDAQYHLVTINTELFSQKMGKGTPAEIRDAANNLFKVCSRFVTLLDNPPPNTPKETMDRARTYRTDILMVEAATAINPAVKQYDVALDRLDKLDKVRSTMTLPQQGAILRYRIEALQGAGQNDKILPVVEEYARSQGQDPIEIMKQMVVSMIDEISTIEQTDPKRAKDTADLAVKLFDKIIEKKIKEGKPKDAFELREMKADMMVRAGDYEGAQNLCKQLEAEEPGKLASYMTEARAIFVQARHTTASKDYATAQDYFTRILPRLTPGIDAYWEAWLRIIQCKEAQGGSAADAEIKKVLGDLKSSTTNVGGDSYKEEFNRLMLKYGI